MSWKDWDPRAWTPRRRRWAPRIAVIALFAYPVLGTLALWTGFVEWLILSEDVKVEFENPSYTIWPGKVHLKHVKIYVNGDTQFTLEGDDLVTNFSVIGFFRHRVQVSKLAAHDVRYRMRVQVKDQTNMHQRLQAYPRLEGLPGVNVIREGAAAKTEEREQSWTVAVEGLDIHVAELWFFEYRYLGSGKLRGGFLIGPQVMQVTTAVQDIGPGELRFGEKDAIAKNFRGQVTCNIPKVNPEQHADASFMELVSARVNLKMDVVSLLNVGAYWDEFEVHGGAGPLALDLFLEKGYLGQKSNLDFQTASVGLKGDGFGLTTDSHLHFDAAAEKGLPLGSADFKSTYLSFSRKDRHFTIQSHGNHAEAALDTIRLGGATDLKRAQLRMPNIISKDLHDLGVLLPEKSTFDVEAGEARASLKLDMDSKYWATGPLEAEILRTKLSAAGVELSGNTWFRSQVRVNPKLKTNLLEDVILRLRNVDMHVKDESVASWWMDVSSKRLALYDTQPPHAEGSPRRT